VQRQNDFDLLDTLISDEKFGDLSALPRAPLATPDSPLHFDTTTEDIIPKFNKISTENAVISENTTGPRKLRLIIGGIIGGVAIIVALAIGATTYLKQGAEAPDAQQRAQMKSKIEKQNQKDGLIGNLRDRIAEVSRRVQALNKQSLKGKRDAWSESLNKLSQRLDDVSNISSELSQEINQACDEIGKELGKIEEDINNLQG
jgi:uncharacterized protein HemX